MQIRTRYSGATDTRGSRIIATATVNGKRTQKSIPYPYELSGVAVHFKAAQNFAESRGQQIRSMNDYRSTVTGYVFDCEVS